jgi:hypothetical protein
VEEAMSDIPFRVRYIDVVPWKGRRHDRLRAIWKAIAKTTEGAVFEPYFNAGKQSHAQCLDAIWREAINGIYEPWRYGDYLAITELDFLPNPGWLKGMRSFLDGAPAMAPIKQRDNAGDTETWLMLFDLWEFGEPSDLRWEHPHDPGADLHEQIPELRRFTGRLGAGGAGDHMGWEYPWGVHLLGSRHLHDPPDLPLWEHCGRVILARELQENHDESVSRWIERQPKRFQELLDE